MITCHGDQSYKNDVNNNCHQRKYTPFGGNFKYTILFDAYGQILIIHEKDEMESIYQRKGLKIIDHFAQDGLAPLLSEKLISGMKSS